MSVLLLLLPLVAAVALFAFRSLPARPIALGATGANLLFSLFLLWGFRGEEARAYALNIDWMPQVGVAFHIGADGISLLMVLLTNILAPFIVLAGGTRAYDREARYYGLVLLMLAALNGVFLAWDGLLFYVFYETALIPIYFICAIWGGENRIRITLKFFLYTFVGSLFMLVALLAVYYQTPATGTAPHSFAWEALTAAELDPTTAQWVMLGFFLAFAVKMPLFPLHTWQPDTYVNAPTGGTMLLSGIMLKMGLYGALRWMIPLAPEAWHGWTPLFLGLAVFGILYAGLIALKQSDLKRLVAYSSIAHVGLMAAGIFVWNKAGLQGSLVQMPAHGINAVGLFFVVDILERRVGSRTLSDMGGIARTAPRLAALYLIVTLGAMAVPLTNGFVGEFLLLNSVWQYHHALGATAGLTVILSAAYLLRAYGLAMFGQPGPYTASVSDLSRGEFAVLTGIAALVLLQGFFPYWILNLTNSSVDRILGAVQM